MARQILVVEDEALIADAIAARLRSEGHDVRIASDGPTGVAYAERFEPDLVMVSAGFDAFATERVMIRYPCWQIGCRTQHGICSVPIPYIQCRSPRMMP